MIDAVVVVGAGLAGIRAIEALRRNGHTGPIVLIGDEVHAPYDRPPLSKGVLAGDLDVSCVQLANAERLQALEVTWRPGAAAVELDVHRRRVALDDGAVVGFRRLVIATGAFPKVLPGTAAIPRMHVLRTIDDTLRLRASSQSAHDVCVLGGGVLGLEIAATLSKSQQVTVLEAADSLLARAFPGGGGMVEAVSARHRSAGLALRVGTKVVQVVDHGAPSASSSTAVSVCSPI